MGGWPGDWMFRTHISNTNSSWWQLELGESHQVLKHKEPSGGTHPHLVFVFNATKTRQILARCGVNTAGWSSSFSGFLGRNASASHRDSRASGSQSRGYGQASTRRSQSPPPRRTHNDQYGDRKPTINEGSSRSRSDFGDTSDQASYSRGASTSTLLSRTPLFHDQTPEPSSRTPPREHSTPSPVILIDILELYNTVAKGDHSADAYKYEKTSFREVIIRLDCLEEREGWNAAKDAE